MKPIAYIRSSLFNTAEEVDGCRNWCARNGYAAAEVFVEEPGQTVKREEMLSLCHDRQVLVVVVWTFNHLGNTLGEMCRTAGRILSEGVDLVSAGQEIDLRGRDTVSVGQRRAVMAFLEFGGVAGAELPPGATEPPNEDPYELKLRVATEHLKEHGNAGSKELSHKLGISVGYAKRLLALAAHELPKDEEAAAS